MKKIFILNIPFIKKHRDYSQIKSLNDCTPKGLQGFRFGLSNHVIKKKLKRICHDKEKIAPVVILGNSGAGKTYLSTCIACEVHEIGKRCLVENTESFVDRLLVTIKESKTERSFLDKYQAYDVIVVDEIEDLRYKMSTQKIFMEYIEKLISGGKYVILMGLGNIESLSALLEVNCQTYQLHALTEAQRKKYVVDVLHVSGIKMSKENVSLITRQDMGAIVGGLNRLLRSTIEERKIGPVYIDSERLKIILGVGFYAE